MGVIKRGGILGGRQLNFRLKYGEEKQTIICIHTSSTSGQLQENEDLYQGIFWVGNPEFYQEIQGLP